MYVRTVYRDAKARVLPRINCQLSAGNARREPDTGRQHTKLVPQEQGPRIDEEAKKE